MPLARIAKELVGEIPTASVRLIQTEDGRNESGLDPNQISCAKQQLLEFQKAVSSIQGGNDSVSRAFEKNKVQARILLFDTRAQMRSRPTSAYLNLDSAPIGSTSYPYSLTIYANLNSDTKGNINCKVASIDQLINAMTKDPRMALQLQGHPIISPGTGVAQ